MVWYDEIKNKEQKCQLASFGYFSDRMELPWTIIIFS